MQYVSLLHIRDDIRFHCSCAECRELFFFSFFLFLRIKMCLCLGERSSPAFGNSNTSFFPKFPGSLLHPVFVFCVLAKFWSPSVSVSVFFFFFSSFLFLLLFFFFFSFFFLSSPCYPIPSACHRIIFACLVLYIINPSQKFSPPSLSLQLSLPLARHPPLSYPVCRRVWIFFYLNFLVGWLPFHCSTSFIFSLLPSSS